MTFFKSIDYAEAVQVTGMPESELKDIVAACFAGRWLDYDPVVRPKEWGCSDGYCYGIEGYYIHGVNGTFYFCTLPLL